MSEPLAFDALVRAWPDAAPPGAAVHDPWPDHGLIVSYRTARPGGGALTYAAARLVGGDHDLEWRVHGRGLPAREARRFFGSDCPYPVLGLEEFLEETLQKACYKPPLRAGLVAWSVPALVSSCAWRVDARGDSFRFTLRTWTREGLVRPNLFRSRIRVRPSSGGRATIGFDRRLKPDPEDWVTRADGKREQYRGRFCSLSSLAYVLTGEDQFTLRQALRVWGITVAKAGGADGLGLELDALCALYRAMLEDLGRWPG